MAGRSSAASLISLALLGLTGCPINEPDTRPFHIRVTVNGSPVAERYDTEQVVRLRGTAVREDDVTLFVANARLEDDTVVGDVRISFDRSALRDLAFPSQFAGADLLLLFRVAPTGTGPRREPLPVPGLRILIEGAPAVSQFLLWEGTYVRERAARVLTPAAKGDPAEIPDFPIFFVEDEWIEADPGECGLVYYDNLIVGTTPPLASLLRRERTSYQVGATPPPWTVAHVLSWHRDGACVDQSRVWTQFAAWRPSP